MPVEVKLRYDRVADALYVKLKEGEIADSEEIAEGIIVDYNREGEVVGVEILQFSKRRVGLSRLVTEGVESLVAWASMRPAV
ncbi:MAG: DUF2283 domain-containing protein [Desulfurococcales archaeon]|nr:DUF2283 domain-containing protein [Desulfurococcales archaeon]